MTENAKLNYLLRTEETLANLGTSSKNYWSLINNLLNKAKFPIIQLLYENGLFMANFKEKAQVFNDYFILQCSTIDTESAIIPSLRRRY